jgi:hypothetical protein
MSYVLPENSLILKFPDILSIDPTAIHGRDGMALFDKVDNP